MKKSPKIALPNDCDVFNPLSKWNLARSVAEALLKSSLHELPPEEFEGAGVYAIYYFGRFELYKSYNRTSAQSEQRPIYVGKAVPGGARKGFDSLDSAKGNSLHKRLKEHADTIDKCENLDVRDFKCRYLLVDDIWISLGESLLIRKFSPLWNVILDGFGNHDPGAGRYEGKRSVWDELHPGRVWAKKCHPSDKRIEMIEKEVLNYIETKIQLID